jgi:alkylation response protein AidB-like acyl-CoA dehydrogenase
MASIIAFDPEPARQAADWVALVHQELGPRFAERAAATDESDRFVADNYADLKAAGLTAAGVPVELGGAGASFAEMSEVIRALGRYCGSTALAFSMHTHQVMMAEWRWRNQQAPVEGMLKRVASERIILLSSGGSDWLHSSGTATRADGGYRINARKIFSSGSPAGDLLLTSAVYEDPEAGRTVLHFGVPMNAAGVRIEPVWRALGMRGTGSNDVVLTDVFVPDAAIGGKRPAGKWHMLFHIVAMVAIPLVYAAYLGVAEAARELAVRHARARRIDAHQRGRVGAMDTELAAARLALADMIAAGTSAAPGHATTNRAFIGRALVARAAIATVEHAMEVCGGAAFYRDLGMERLFRDVQGARYHPLTDSVQRDYAGCIALDVDPDSVL